MPFLIEQETSKPVQAKTLENGKPLTCLIPVGLFEIRREKGRLMSVPNVDLLKKFSVYVTSGTVVLEVSPTKLETLVFKSNKGPDQGRMPVERISSFLTVYGGTKDEQYKILLRPTGRNRSLW